MRTCKVVRATVSGVSAVALSLAMMPAVAVVQQPADELAYAAEVNEAVGSWNIGKPAEADGVATDSVIAKLYADGTLVFSGAGDCLAYNSDWDNPEDYAVGTHSTAPWCTATHVACKKIKRVVFENGVEPTDMSYWFYDCTNLQEVVNLPASVEKMSHTFTYCESLTGTPDIPDSVTDMQGTFLGCTSLINAPKLSQNVKDISSVFESCTSLVETPIIPASVEDMSSAFLWCSSLKSAPEIPQGVNDMMCAFVGCESLTVAPLIPSSVRWMSDAFAYCPNLTTLPQGFRIPKKEIYEFLEWLYGDIDDVDIDAQYTNMTEDVFVLDEDGQSSLKAMHVEGTPDSSILEYDWESDGRVLAAAPVKPSVSKLSAGKKCVKAKVAKQKVSVSKIQVSYKAGKGKWVTKTFKGNSLNKKISKLDSGQKYKFKVRSYKRVDGEDFYSAWSAVKTAKVK